MIIIKNKKKHELDVAAIQAAMRSKSRSPVARLAKSSNTLHDKAYRKKCAPIDLSKLKGIIELDAENLYVVAEPGVTMKELCNETLKKGLVPCVVPEFTSITVGGAIMGAAIESSSHLYGQFSDICLEYELILGDGSTIKANLEENSDLFSAIPGSYGTFALLTSAKIKLRKAEACVRLTYHYFDKREELCKFLQQPCRADFIDAVILDETKAVAVVGISSPFDPNLPLFEQKNSAAKWFYQHLSQADKSKTTTELMPVRDYLFRYDLGAFWMGRFLLAKPILFQTLLQFNLKSVARRMAHKNPPISPSFFIRTFFGWAFESRFLYSLFHRVPKKIMERLFLIHDFYAPQNAFKDILEEFIKDTELYPIWLCPVKGGGKQQFLSPHFGSDSYINIGLYGLPQNDKGTIDLTKLLEKKIVERGGRKMLYSFSYYTPAEFSKIYDGQRIQELREKYRAENRFISLHEKVCSWQMP
jgi:delta24-sterol reductase